MTTPRPTPDRMASPESWRQQSMLYLLGELDAEQTRFVEQQLEAFPELGEDLLRQADLIAGLSQAALVPTLPRAAETHPSVTRWPLVASMVAVAACLAILVFGVKPSASDRDTVAAQSGSSAKMSKTSHREDLLIARAWASHQRSVADDLGFVEPDVDEALAITAEDDSLVNESTLSWMFMAVSANSELLASGVRNDG